jgi:hypothetical protein
MIIPGEAKSFLFFQIGGKYYYTRREKTQFFMCGGIGFPINYIGWGFEYKPTNRILFRGSIYLNNIFLIWPGLSIGFLF